VSCSVDKNDLVEYGIQGNSDKLIQFITTNRDNIGNPNTKVLVDIAIKQIFANKLHKGVSRLEIEFCSHSSLRNIILENFNTYNTSFKNTKRIYGCFVRDGDVKIGEVCKNLRLIPQEKVFKLVLGSVLKGYPERSMEILEEYIALTGNKESTPKTFLQNVKKYKELDDDLERLSNSISNLTSRKHELEEKLLKYNNKYSWITGYIVGKLTKDIYELAFQYSSRTSHYLLLTTSSEFTTKGWFSILAGDGGKLAVTTISGNEEDRPLYVEIPPKDKMEMFLIISELSDKEELIRNEENKLRKKTTEFDKVKKCLNTIIRSS